MTLKFRSRKRNSFPPRVVSQTRYAHDMTADHQEHRAHLQRIAFGRADSPAEQERANQALRQLQQAEANDIRDAEPTTATYRAIVGADAAQHDASVAAADRRHKRFARVEAAFGTDLNGDGEGNFGGSARPASVLDRPLSSLPRSVLPVIAIGLIAIGAIGGVAATGASAASPLSVAVWTSVRYSNALR